MLNFEIKELTNVKFSHQKLLNYYNKIVEQYQHLKWTPELIDTGNHNVGGVYSWAIQSNLKDTSKPCPPYDIKHDDEVIGTFNNPTELIFDFGKIIVDAFPNVRQTVISAHPPSTRIQSHVDNTEFVKVHIPIITNKDSYFYFDNTEYNLEIGKAYLINTTLPHGTDNRGDTDRVHLIFKIPISDALKILETDYILDADLLDFDILELQNFKINFNDLANYYSSVSSNFENHKWTIPERDPTRDPKKYPSGYDHSVGIYGYAVQTNLKNPSGPAPAFNDKHIPKELKLPYATNVTELCFGIAKTILDKLPFVEEMVITGHPPKSKISAHKDSDVNVRVHIPITANNDSYFIYGDNKYNLEVGKIYVVNTNRTHSTDNQGNSDRVHLFFKIPIGKVQEIINLRLEI